MVFWNPYLQWRNSDHSWCSNFSVNLLKDGPFHQTSFKLFYLESFSWSYQRCSMGKCLWKAVAVPASESSGWFCIRTDVYISYTKSHIMPHSFTWFSSTSVAVITAFYRNHFFYTYQLDRTFDSIIIFRQALYCWKTVLKSVELDYAEKIEIQRSQRLKTIAMYIFFSVLISLGNH